MHPPLLAQKDLGFYNSYRAISVFSMAQNNKGKNGMVLLYFDHQHSFSQNLIPKRAHMNQSLRQMTSEVKYKIPAPRRLQSKLTVREDKAVNQPSNFAHTGM